MHKGVLLLTQSASPSGAKTNVKRFMSEYSVNGDVAPYVEYTKEEIALIKAEVTKRVYSNDCPEFLETYKNNIEEMSLEEFFRSYNETELFDKEGNALTTRNPNAVWDWYVIGGRWSGILSTSSLDEDKLESFYEDYGDKVNNWSQEEHDIEAKKLFLSYFPNYKGKVPIVRDTYADGFYEDDVMPLSLVQPLVKDWLDNFFEVQIPELEQRLEYWKKEESNQNKIKYDPLTINMVEYAEQKLSQAKKEEFSFDSNIFNIDYNNMQLPEDPNGWYVVVVDMHC
ncbi:MAG: hypothetical protein ACOCQR_00035 [bacterium]